MYTSVDRLRQWEKAHGFMHTEGLDGRNQAHFLAFSDKVAYLFNEFTLNQDKMADLWAWYGSCKKRIVHTYD